MRASSVIVWAVAAGMACAPLAAAAQGRLSRVQRQQEAMALDVPKCPRSLGTLTIADGDNAHGGWRQYNLAAPQKLLKVMVQRSGCFTLVDRGAGMTAARTERELSTGGDLQRGSNVGKGQIRSADYVLVAEVAAADADSGGAGVGLGGLASVAGSLGGRLGRLGSVAGALGGVKTTRMEANTTLTLTDVRTSETRAVTEGYATRTNTSFGGGAGFGFGGAIGGGYEDTEIGRIVTQAFMNAYVSLVGDLGGLQGGGAQAAAQRAFKVVKPVPLRRSPSESASLVRQLDPGLLVYPTGAKEGMWWEVADENDNTGWVLNDNLSPAT